MTTVVEQPKRTKPIRRVEDIPKFASKEEEFAFWDTHYFTEEFWDTAPVPKESIVQRALRRAQEREAAQKRTSAQ